MSLIREMTVLDVNGNKLKVDPTTLALDVIDYEHAEIHAGSHFYYKNWVDIGGSSVVDFLAITPNTTKWSHFVVEFSFEAEANVVVYEAPTVSANGAAITTQNRNRNSLTVATLLLYLAPTVTTTGTNIAAYKAGSGKSVGGKVRAIEELVLKQNTLYLIRITNDTVSANWCDYLADWYEHINTV